MEKSYRFTDENSELLFISPNADATVEVHLAATGKQKANKISYSLKDAPLMGASTKGVRISTQKVKKINLK